MLTVGQEDGLSKSGPTNVDVDHELMQPVWDFLGCRTPQRWLEAAVQHAIAGHGERDTPELRTEIRKMIKAMPVAKAA